MQDKIYNEVKSELDSIVSVSQETSQITQLYHRGMNQFQKLINYHTGVPDKKNEYYTVTNSPEVFEDIRVKIRQTQKNFYDAAIKIGHIDMMFLFADELSYKPTKADIELAQKYALEAGRGALPTSVIKLTSEPMYELSDMFDDAPLFVTIKETMNQIFGHVFSHASNQANLK